MLDDIKRTCIYLLGHFSIAAEVEHFDNSALLILLITHIPTDRDLKLVGEVKWLHMLMRCDLLLAAGAADEGKNNL